MSELASLLVEPSWLLRLTKQFEQPYMKSLEAFLESEYAADKLIYPAKADIFHALNKLPFERVKVIVLGQDPYHGAGQAEGLSFSVPPGVAVPPSLKNIYKEISRDIQCPMPAHFGCLQSWLEQGVLLLNSVLTVEAGRAGSHRNRGWETFTDHIIHLLSEQASHCVFMLWGGYAKNKQRLIDTDKHLVLNSSHPSPLSAYRGFLGCGHFSTANSYLLAHGEEAINWQIFSEQYLS